jgi:tetratricopeptide (TPR) repeat protein
VTKQLRNRQGIIWSLACLASIGAASAAAWWWLVERPVQLVRAAYEESDWAHAFQLASAHLQSHPGRRDVKLLAARSAGRLGRFADAQEHYEQLTDLSLEDLRLQASAAIGLGQWSRAAALLESIIDAEPEDPEALLKLAALRYKEGQDVEATELAERAVELLEHTPLAAAAYSQLGAVESARGNRVAAIACFRKALQLDPDGKRLGYQLPQLRLDLANNLLLTGAPAEAQVQLEAVLASSPPNRARVLYELGRVRLAQQDTDGAQQCWQQTLAEDPRHARSLVALSELALRRKHADEAVRLLELAIECEPQNGHAHYALARAYIQLGQPEAARIQDELARRLRDESLNALAADRVLLNHPDSPDAKVILAMREAARENWPQAEHWAREAVRLAPGDARFQRVLERVRARQLPAGGVPQ